MSNDRPIGDAMSNRIYKARTVFGAQFEVVNEVKSSKNAINLKNTLELSQQLDCPSYYLRFQF